MGKEGNTFSPQLPENSQYSAALYEPHREFRAGLEKIATHIAGGGAPMTFALYGEWGTGKSTALAYLQGLIRERDDKVTFSWCQAPLWARYQDERSALALEILRGVERGIPANVADMLAGLLKFDMSPVGGLSQSDDYELAASLAFLKVLGSIPNAPPVIEQWILRYIARTNSRRHVVMLDDLDRCEPEFVARLLKATNHWTVEVEHGDEPNEHRSASIYFVLACREDFLVSSQMQGEVKDPQQSLEKYVHVTVSIPQLLNRPADTANYLRMLVTRLEGLPTAARERLAAMIDVSAETYPDGLFAPLLRVAGDSSTPRAIKTRLNVALTEIDYEQLDDDTLVKEWIIKAFWPDFWINQYRALLTQQDTLSERFEPIRTVGERLKGLLDMSDEALTEALTHVGAEVRADLTDVRPQLAIYLACDPAWPARPARTAGVFPPDRFAPADTSDIARRSYSEKAEDRDGDGRQVSSSLLEPGEHHSDTSQPVEDIPSPPDTELPTDPDDQIFFFYLAADSAEDRGDRRLVEESLHRMLEVARWMGPNTARGATIGNAALIADRSGFREMALEFHQLARAAEPNHFNIMQNYIDFILDEGISSAYPEAQRLYQRLITDGKHHKPFRTLLIGIRLADVTHESIPDLAERKQQILSMLAMEPSNARLMDIGKLPASILGYDTLRSACKIVAEHAKSAQDFFTTLQVMVAVIGGSNNHADEREVVDASRWMIRVGLACAGGDALYANFLHNLGLQLGSLGYRSAATLVYAEAYRMRPQDADYRRALATSLERMGSNEDATAVLLGRPSNIEGIQPEELPVFLSEQDHTDRWWEELRIPPAEPCPTNLPWLIPQQPETATGEDHGER